MKIVLIGHGMVGQKFLESLLETGLTDVEVTVLCEEPRAAYDRVHLSEFFSGKTAEDLSLVEPGFFERKGFSLRLATRAAAIDRRSRTVSTADGEVFPYDKLVLATGSNPFVPQVPGRDREHWERASREIEAEAGKRPRKPATAANAKPAGKAKSVRK